MYFPEDNYYQTPDEPVEETVYFCAVCGASIHDGDRYYDINDEKWCEECIVGVSHVA